MEKFFKKSNPLIVWLVYFFSYIVFFFIFTKFVQIFLGWTFLYEFTYCIRNYSGVWYCDWYSMRAHGILLSILATLTTLGFRSKDYEKNYFVLAFFSQFLVWGVLFVWGFLGSTLLFWIIPPAIHHEIPWQLDNLIFEGIGMNVIVSFFLWCLALDDK